MTIDSLLAAQNVDELIGGSSRKRFILHYEFPPYAVNEIGKQLRQGRREIGHSNLAERALSPIIPSELDFPYTVRLISEITGSNGSSSMATTCGGSLALMDAGVPIRKHVAGITCGLITHINESNGDIEKYRLITDISGIEDHLGDMDFKITGTELGITAGQLDLKVAGIPLSILEEALDQADRGKLKLLEYMNSIIEKPRETCKSTAPLFGNIILTNHDNMLKSTG